MEANGRGIGVAEAHGLADHKATVTGVGGMLTIPPPCKQSSIFVARRQPAPTGLGLGI